MMPTPDYGYRLMVWGCVTVALLMIAGAMFAGVVVGRGLDWWIRGWQ